MIKEAERFISSTVFEGMTSIRAVLDNLKENKENARKIEKILIDKEKLSTKSKEIGYLRKMAELFNFEIQISDENTINRYTDNFGSEEVSIPVITTRFIKKLLTQHKMLCKE